MGIDSVGPRPSTPPITTPKPPAPVAADSAAPATVPTAAKPAGHTGDSAYVGQHLSTGAGKADPSAAAKANYTKNGSQVFDINTREGRESLVVQSPQVDSIDATKTDTTRCGGAAITDALLLDGAPKANAAAITKVKARAEANGATYTQEQNDALKAMSSGKMTPNQAAHMQELMMTTAKHLPPNPPGATMVDDKGITPLGMANTLGQINAHGGLKNSGNIEMTAETRKNEKGQEYGHWTLTTRDKNLFPTTVDPWPNENGQKTMTRGREPQAQPPFIKDPDFKPLPSDRMDPTGGYGDGEGKGFIPNPKFKAQVVLYPREEGEKTSLVDVRTGGMPNPPDKATELGYKKHYGHVQMKVGKPDETTTTMTARHPGTHEEMKPD